MMIDDDISLCCCGQYLELGIEKELCEVKEGINAFAMERLRR